MNFGEALQVLKAGRPVSREGWNGKGMFLVLVPAMNWHTHGITNEWDPCPAASPWIGMRTADNHFVPWVASITDHLAEDWRAEEPEGERP